MNFLSTYILNLRNFMLFVIMEYIMLYFLFECVTLSFSALYGQL